MYIANVPFKERFEVLESKGEAKLLFDKINNNHAVQTSTDIYTGYSQKGAKELFEKVKGN